MTIKVNWNQGKSPRLLRGHQVVNNQPKGCQFGKLKNSTHSNFSNISSAETEMKNRGFTKYKPCKHCWDNRLIDPIP
jgi:hypothetical protein